MSASPGFSSVHEPTFHPEDETNSQKERSKRLFESIEQDDVISSGLTDDSDFEHNSTKRRKLNFPNLKTRVEYHQEFRQLPETRSHFDHEKYQTHRLLQFEKTGGAWTLEDLESPAVLERGLELILRVISGASHVDLVPVPQINLSGVPRNVLYWLMDVAAGFAGAEQGLALAEKRIEELEPEVVEDHHESGEGGGGDDDHEHGEDVANEEPDDYDIIILDGPSSINRSSRLARSDPSIIIEADRPAVSAAKDEVEPKSIKSEEIGKDTQSKVEEAENLSVKQESAHEDLRDDSYLRTWLDQLPDQDCNDKHSSKKDSAPTGALRRIKKEPNQSEMKSQEGPGTEDDKREPAAEDAGSQLEPIVIDDESQADDDNDEDDNDDDVMFVSESRRPSRNDNAVQFVSENRVSPDNVVRFGEEDWRATLRRQRGFGP